MFDVSWSPEIREVCHRYKKTTLSLQTRYFTSEEHNKETFLTSTNISSQKKPIQIIFFFNFSFVGSGRMSGGGKLNQREIGREGGREEQRETSIGM